MVRRSRSRDALPEGLGRGAESRTRRRGWSATSMVEGMCALSACDHPPSQGGLVWQGAGPSESRIATSASRQPADPASADSNN